MRQPSSLYRRHRFPGEIISHAVWLGIVTLTTLGPAAGERRRVWANWSTATRRRAP
jgi:hypothetical protein